MKNLDLKTIGIIAAFVLLVALAIFFYGKKKGAQPSKYQSVPNPNGGTGTTTGTGGESSNANVIDQTTAQNLAKNMRDACYQFGVLTSTKEAVAQAILNCSNASIQKIANYWNTVYFNESNETMYQAMQAEFVFAIGQSPWADLKARLITLGLT